MVSCQFGKDVKSNTSFEKTKYSNCKKTNYSNCENIDSSLYNGNSNNSFKENKLKNKEKSLINNGTNDVVIQESRAFEISSTNREEDLHMIRVEKQRPFHEFTLRQQSLMKRAEHIINISREHIKEDQHRKRKEWAKLWQTKPESLQNLTEKKNKPYGHRVSSHQRYHPGLNLFMLKDKISLGKEGKKDVLHKYEKNRNVEPPKINSIEKKDSLNLKLKESQSTVQATPKTPLCLTESREASAADTQDTCKQKEKFNIKEEMIEPEEAFAVETQEICQQKEIVVNLIKEFDVKEEKFLHIISVLKNLLSEAKEEIMKLEKKQSEGENCVAALTESEKSTRREFEHSKDLQRRQSIRIENLEKQMAFDQEAFRRTIHEKDCEIEDLRKDLHQYQMQNTFQATPSSFTEPNISIKETSKEACNTGEDYQKELCHNENPFHSYNRPLNVENLAALNAERRYKFCNTKVIESLLSIAPIEVQVINHGKERKILRKKEKTFLRQDIGDVTIDMKNYSIEINKIIRERKGKEARRKGEKNVGENIQANSIEFNEMKKESIEQENVELPRSDRNYQKLDTKRTDHEIQCNRICYNFRSLCCNLSCFIREGRLQTLKGQQQKNPSIYSTPSKSRFILYNRELEAFVIFVKPKEYNDFIYHYRHDQQRHPWKSILILPLRDVTAIELVNHKRFIISYRYNEKTSSTENLISKYWQQICHKIITPSDQCNYNEILSLEIDIQSFPPFSCTSYNPKHLPSIDCFLSQEKVNKYVDLENIILQKTRSFIPEDILQEIKDAKIEINHINVLIYLMERIILEYHSKYTLS